MMKARSILILCLFLCVLVVDAQDSFTQDRFLYKVINDSVVELSEATYPAVNAYSPRNRTLVIPGYVQHEGRRYSVRSVSGFNYEPDLQHVMVEDGVESLIDAFRDCSELRYVTLPQTLETIEQRAFEGCPVDSVLKATAESVGRLQKINP